jgi:hypothetical protein
MINYNNKFCSELSHYQNKHKNKSSKKGKLITFYQISS